MNNIDQNKLELVEANHILARENVVDAFGHASIRHPENSDQYFMSRSRSPELVEFSDLMLFTLDGEAIDLQGRSVYGERMIHGAIYEARPDINAIIHNHSLAVIPFGLTDTVLKPAIHVAAVIGEEIPIWDNRDYFGDEDMLVRNIDKARHMALAMGDNRCLLMRGHGAVVVGRTVKEAVMTAVSLQVNALVQTEAMKMGTPTFLSSKEIEIMTETQFSSLAVDRAWEYFCKRADKKAK